MLFCIVSRIHLWVFSLFCVMYSASEKVSTVILLGILHYLRGRMDIVASRSYGGNDELNLKTTPYTNSRKTVKKICHRSKFLFHLYTGQT